jgi:hypothetical protein
MYVHGRGDVRARAPRWVGVAVVALLCAASAGAEDRAGPAAWVAGRPVTRAEVADFLFERRRETWLEALDDLVDERIALEDAARWRLDVPAATLDRAVEAEAAARASQVRETYGEGADLAALVREAYGLDPAAWRARILRPRLRAQLLLHRVVRLDARRREAVEARVVVLTDPARASEVRSKVAAGADFGLVALRESRDPSAKNGGALPPIARGDLVDRRVEEHLFAAPPGAIVGPLEVAGPAASGGAEPGRRWHVYKVVRRHEAWGGDPASWPARLEADLAERPAQRSEFLAWRRRVRRERDVRLLAPDGSPLGPR